MAKNEVINITDQALMIEVITYPDNKRESKIFEWRDILGVKVVKGSQKKFLFLKTDFERIEIVTSNPETPQYKIPVLLDKARVGSNFEDIIGKLKDLSKSKNFTFEDKRK